MSDVHVATSGPKARELVEAVLGEFDRWAAPAPSQAAGICPTDSHGAARYALQDVREMLADHLVVRVGVLLASWGVSDE